MKPAAINCSTLTVCLCIALAAQIVRAGPNDLLAEGAGDRLWAAHVVQNADRQLPGQRTVFRARGAGESERWRQAAEVAAPASALTHRGSELVVLFESGEWKFVSDAGVRGGDRLPGDAPVRALAGDGNSLYAVGLAHPMPTTRTATRSATRRAAAAAAAGGAATTSAAVEIASAPTPPTTTAPTTASAQVPLGLFRLERGEWVLVTPLPALLPQNQLTRLVLTIAGGRPLLAGLLRDGSIRTVELSRDHTWLDRATIRPSFEIQRMELLDYRGQPTLWLAGETGAGEIYLHDGSAWSKAIELKPGTTLGPGTDRALAVAFGRLRLLYAGGDGKLFEQSFNPDGSADAPPTQGTVRPPPPDPRVMQFVQLGVMILLMFVMLSTLRRRGSIQEAMRRADRLSLAPLGSRLAAGLIDALPLLVVPAFLAYTEPTLVAAQLRLEDPAMQGWSVAATALYLLHTTVCELFFARTLGKLLLGMRVADLSGARPPAKAMVIRNVLRLVDLLLIGFPLIMVLLSPLRQRIGDVAAGTLVVRADVVIPPEDPPPAEDEE